MPICHGKKKGKNRLGTGDFLRHLSKKIDTTCLRWMDIVFCFHGGKKKNETDLLSEV